jgi:hypothetical protein
MPLGVRRTILAAVCGLALAGAAAAGLFSPGPAQAPAPPAAPPASPPDTRPAKEIFDSVFAEDLKRARATPDTRDDLDLAARMLVIARRADSSPELATLVARAVVDLVGKLPAGLPLAIEAMQRAVEKDPDHRSQALEDLVNLRQAAFTRSGSKDHEEAGRQLVDALAAAGDDRAAALDLAKAVAFYRRAVDVGGSVRHPELEEIQAKVILAHARQAAMTKAEVLAMQFEAAPDDAATRDELIRLYVAELDAPDRAAKLLQDQPDDVRGKLLLVADMTRSNLPEAALARLGQYYASLADGATPVVRPVVLRRAAAYWQAFLDKHADDDEARQSALAACKAVDDKLFRLLPRPKLPPGAVLLLSFDKPTYVTNAGRTFVRDLSGQNNNGLVAKAALAKGVVGDALGFNGTDAFVEIANSPSLQTVGSQTISVWLMPTVLDNNRCPLGKAYGGEGALTVLPDGTISYLYGSAGGDSDPHVAVNSAARLEVDKWTHVVVIRDLAAKKVTWYRNGRKTAEAAIALVPAASTQALYLGAGYAGSFAGALDELALYGRALTEKEVADLYDLGRRGLGFGLK